MPNKLDTFYASVISAHFYLRWTHLAPPRLTQIRTQDFGQLFRAEFECCGPQPRCSSLHLPTTITLFTMSTDPSSSSANSTKTEGIMIPYMHFLLGDAVIFKEWIPHGRGAMAGACIGLFFLAILERFSAGMRGVIEAKWKRE